MNSDPRIDDLARKASEAHLTWLRLSEERDGSPEMAQAIADAYGVMNEATDAYWDAMETFYPDVPIEELPSYWDWVD